MNSNLFFLLADDDHDDAELFHEALTGINTSIKFHHVANGQAVFEFLGRLDSEKPDVIFLDLNMPAMSGWQCLAKLKNDAASKDIPVIMFSTSSNPREREIATDLGAVGFVTKPADIRVLIKTLDIIVNSLKDDLQRILKEISTN